ncbi:hypothetical protein KDV48_09090 [Citrobacter sedlakii]|uniref:hypothetical protein n=1 Tax=Citrobacter sedlakii TaxID=67826 RepID=UPI0033357394|nr:hypothetical protein [Citrobacter sedlakii]
MDIKYYTDENDVSPLEKWLAKNRAAIPKVFTAVERLRSGNTSSVKWLSGRPGIGEYRINWGAGLRVYLMQDGDEIVIFCVPVSRIGKITIWTPPKNTALTI